MDWSDELIELVASSPASQQRTCRCNREVTPSCGVCIASIVHGIHLRHGRIGHGGADCGLRSSYAWTILAMHTPQDGVNFRLQRHVRVLAMRGDDATSSISSSDQSIGSTELMRSFSSVVRSSIARTRFSNRFCLAKSLPPPQIDAEITILCSRQRPAHPLPAPLPSDPMTGSDHA